MAMEADDAGDDPLEFLQQKRREVALMTQAAAVAQEQACRVMELQRKTEALAAHLDGGSSEEPFAREADAGGMSSLSYEDKVRFGLIGETEAAPSASAAPEASAGPEASAAPEDPEPSPSWSSLSAADRLRFGLGEEEMRQAPSCPRVPAGPSSVLSPSLAKTLAQLEALGMSTSAASIADSERKLERLRLR
ncbi:unnamed protein product [Effrenium voratum]|uniref:Uncharacterized protein n=1 Tax=Effrenium voratum TaxID=2562239 RepID=A0AA36N648_9DINO|nr:unnamed protein product [Effrenium voratum]